MLFLWIFLPAVFIGYRLLHEKYRNIFLLLASLVFYGWGEPKNLDIMIVSILMNYFCGLGIGKFENKWKKVLLIAGVIVNLAVLAYFKYMTPSLETVSKLFQWDNLYKGVALPIGISFYTFQAISYIADVYRGTIKPQKNLIDMGLYITFFPQLIAGPIVKYHDIEQQLKVRPLELTETAYGVRRFIYGLAKKVLIANQIATISDDIFAIPVQNLDTPVAWLGVIAFYLQVYFDFSGYSDMAIGLGHMFGFRFMENFNYPFISRSIREFWQRWNISVFTWFREYLYFPLGGSRKGELRTNLNILIVFTATGIWHGAAFNFMFWGIYWGILMLIERAWIGKYLDKPSWRIPSHIYFIVMICIGGVFFQTENLLQTAKYLSSMFLWHNNPALHLRDVISLWGWLLVGAAVILSGPLQTLVPSLRNALFREDRIYIMEIPLLILLLAASVFVLSGSSYNPFIYFRF